MDLRAPAPQPDPDGTGGPAAQDPTKPAPDPTKPAPDLTTPVAWRVDRRLTIAKWAGAVIFAVAALLGYPDWGQVLVVGFGAALAAALAVRDMLAPVRLAADIEGLTIRTGFAGTRRIGWPQVHRVLVDARRGLLVRSQVLELDTGDDLYFFGVNDLGVPLEEVADRLEALRSRSGR